MLGVLGLLTSWVLLAPALVLCYALIGGGYALWMAPFLGIASSLPLLGFFTLGGGVLMAWSVRRLARAKGDFS